MPEAWLATISRARSSVRFVLLCSSRGCGRFLYKTPPERRELPLDPVDPLLSALGRGIGDPCGLSETGAALVQYWRSYEDLERFARNPDDPHLPAWRRFN